MNLFKALFNGVQGVLEGKILKVQTFRQKEEGKKDSVKVTVGIPDLFINFDVFIPERFVPDAVEGMEIQLLPVIKVEKWNKPEIGFEVVKIL